MSTGALCSKHDIKEAGHGIMSGSPTIQQSAHGSTIDGDDDVSQHYPAEGLPPHPDDFMPFFTLIEDRQTGEHFHPHVHYVFADDDQDTVTDVALAAIAQQDDLAPDANKERFMIVDMTPDGKSVKQVVSLSDDWQTVRASVGEAASWGSGEESGNRGLMLKLTGQEVEAKSLKVQGQTVDIARLLQTFDEQLKGLDEIVRESETGIIGGAEVQLPSARSPMPGEKRAEELQGTG